MTMEKTTRRLARKRFALALCLMVMALRLPVSLLSRLVWPDMDVNPVSFYLATIVRETVLWLAPALTLLPWRTRRLGAKLPSALLVPAALGCGALVQLGFHALHLLLPRGGGAVTPMPESGAEWLLAVLSLVIVPAVCEEAFFRGALTVHLMDTTSPAWTLLLGTALFALMHGDASGLAAHLAVSACCTLLMMATGRVWPCMLLHMGYNASALGLTLLHVSPWMLFLALVPVAAAIALGRGVRWKRNGKCLNKTDVALLCVILALEAAQYASALL